MEALIAFAIYYGLDIIAKAMIKCWGPKEDEKDGV